jgi:hypothetical protein
MCCPRYEMDTLWHKICRHFLGSTNDDALDDADDVTSFASLRATMIYEQSNLRGMRPATRRKVVATLRFNRHARPCEVARF